MKDESTREENQKSVIFQAVEKRDALMRGYYKAVIVDDFEGGYPISWDTNLNAIIEKEISKAKQETWDKAIAIARKYSPAESEVVSDLVIAKEKDI